MVRKTAIPECYSSLCSPWSGHNRAAILSYVCEIPAKLDWNKRGKEIKNVSQEAKTDAIKLKEGIQQLAQTWRTLHDDFQFSETIDYISCSWVLRDILIFTIYPISADSSLWLGMEFLTSHEKQQPKLLLLKSREISLPPCHPLCFIHKSCAISSLLYTAARKGQICLFAM